MGKVTRMFDDPLQEVYRRLKVHDRALMRIRSKGISLAIRSNIDPSTGMPYSLFLQDGDGEVWLDAQDNNIHYQVGGVEYVVTATPA